MRFEPGDIKTVTLVAIGGHKIITGGNRLASGQYDPSRTDAIVNALVAKGFGHAPEPGALDVVAEPKVISRETYLGMFGPTVGDRVRLGDTDLWVEVEKDLVGHRSLAAWPTIHDESVPSRHITVTNASLEAARLFVREWDKQPIAPHTSLWTSSSRTLSSSTGLEFTRSSTSYLFALMHHLTPFFISGGHRSLRRQDCWNRQSGQSGRYGRRSSLSRGWKCNGSRCGREDDRHCRWY